MDTLSDLRKRALLLEPAVRVGKKGLTPSLIAEIDTLLSKRGLVKVKMLRASLGGEIGDEGQEDADAQSAALSKDDLATAVAKKTKSLLVHQVGLTFTLFRKHEQKKTSAP